MFEEGCLGEGGVDGMVYLSTGSLVIYLVEAPIFSKVKEYTCMNENHIFNFYLFNKFIKLVLCERDTE